MVKRVWMAAVALLVAAPAAAQGGIGTGGAPMAGGRSGGFVGHGGGRGGPGGISGSGVARNGGWGHGRGHGSDGPGRGIWRGRAGSLDRYGSAYGDRYGDGYGNGNGNRHGNGNGNGNRYGYGYGYGYGYDYGAAEGARTIGTGFFAEGAGRSVENGRVVYDYDRGYPYQNYRRSARAAAPLPIPASADWSCSSEHEVRVCRR